MFTKRYLYVYIRVVQIFPYNVCVCIALSCFPVYTNVPNEILRKAWVIPYYEF